MIFSSGKVGVFKFIDLNEILILFTALIGFRQLVFFFTLISNMTPE
jgi:hypothetical protein